MARKRTPSELREIARKMLAAEHNRKMTQGGKVIPPDGDKNEAKMDINIPLISHSYHFDMRFIAH